MWLIGQYGKNSKMANFPKQQSWPEWPKWPKKLKIAN